MERAPRCGTISYVNNPLSSSRSIRPKLYWDTTSMRIAVLGIKSLPAFAGADRVVEILLRHLPPEHSYHVYVATRDRPNMPDLTNVHFIYIPALTGKHLRAFSYFLFCSLHSLFLGDYDVAHVHNSDFGLLCAILKLKRGTKIVGTFHGNPYERAKWGRIAKAYLKLSESCFVLFADRLTSVSRFKKSERKPVSYIPNGIDTDFAISESGGFDYGAYQIEIGQYILFACGRLDSTKGLHTLLEAFCSLTIPLKLFAIGDFSHDRQYADRIEALARPRKDIVLHRTLLAKPILLEILRGARLFVFPSEVEAMSMMLLEAVSLKTLVVCSDISENREVMGDNYKYLFKVKSATDLSEKITGALRERDVDATMEGVLERCRKEFSWDAIAHKYVAIYEAAYRDLSHFVQ